MCDNGRSPGKDSQRETSPPLVELKVAVAKYRLVAINKYIKCNSRITYCIHIWYNNLKTVSPVFRFFLFCFCLHKNRLFSCQMFHYVHWLVTNFVSIVWCWAGRVQWLSTENSCLLCLETMLMRAVKWNQNGTVQGLKTKTMSCKTPKYSM